MGEVEFASCLRSLLVDVTFYIDNQTNFGTLHKVDGCIYFMLIGAS